MLARARRSVVTLDAGPPRNAPAAGVHGLLARDGVRPAELLERGRAEVRRYGGQVVAGEVTTAVRDPEGFTVALADGRSVRAAAGAAAAADINADLVAEETRQAVAAYRDGSLTGAEGATAGTGTGSRGRTAP